MLLLLEVVKEFVLSCEWKYYCKFGQQSAVWKSTKTWVGNVSFLNINGAAEGQTFIIRMKDFFFLMWFMLCIHLAALKDEMWLIPTQYMCEVHNDIPIGGLQMSRYNWETEELKDSMSDLSTQPAKMALLWVLWSTQEACFWKAQRLSEHL